MMKTFKNFLLAAFVVAGISAVAQPSFYDLTFLSDSTTSPYAAEGTYVYMKSKRGDAGMPTTEEGDAIKSSEITKIILVFSEDSPEALENRESYNQERWDNLISTYPEYFQEKTKYKNICQCSPEAGGDNFKAVQGFYIFYKGAGPAPTTPPPAEPKKEPVAVAKNDPPKADPPKADPPKADPPKADPPKADPPKVDPPKSEPIPVKSEPVVNNDPPKSEETPAPAVAPKAPAKKAASDDEEVVESKSSSKKRAGYGNKPRKAKDPKACRPACYGYGEEDLVAFFKDITLTKKQKRKAKKYQADLRIALHFDGTIKKVTLTGGNNDELNALINEALKSMNPWNPAVKGGVAIKSEVRMTIKFDKETKTFKPFNILINPKPNPKCKCASDSEIFGS